MYNHGQKSLDTFAFLGRFPRILICPAPPLTPQTTLDACIQNFFRVSTLFGVEGRRTERKCRKGCTVLWGNPEITENYEYCISVPKDFCPWLKLWWQIQSFLFPFFKVLVTDFFGSVHSVEISNSSATDVQQESLCRYIFCHTEKQLWGIQKGF